MNCLTGLSNDSSKIWRVEWEGVSSGLYWSWYLKTSIKMCKFVWMNLISAKTITCTCLKGFLQYVCRCDLSLSSGRKQNSVFKSANQVHCSSWGTSPERVQLSFKIHRRTNKHIVRSRNKFTKVSHLLGKNNLTYTKTTETQ